MKRPSFQFYPSDWRKDPALSACSMAARGLWIELMCIAHESDNYGHLEINGKAMTVPQLARMVGESPTVVSKLVAELDNSGVFSKSEEGVIYSRRMVKDERIRNIRAEAGRLGGNPSLVKPNDDGLVKQKDNILLNQNSKQKPTPSSSSSFSEIPSEAKASGGKPPLTPDEIIFGYGVPILTNAGTSEKQARSFLGGLRKAHGDDALVNTLRECIRAKPLQPLEWLAKAMPPDAIGAGETKFQKAKREQMERDFPNLTNQKNEVNHGSAVALG